MALTDKLTAIGNAIRSKTGKSAALTLPEMVAEINALSAPVSAYVAIKELSSHQSANVPLCTLPDSVYAHKDDDDFTVTLINLTPSSLENYDEFVVTVSNHPDSPKQSSYPVCGVGARRNSASSVSVNPVYYPPNSSDNNTNLGGIGKIWLNGKVLTYKSAGYFLGGGTLKIIVSWGTSASGEPSSGFTPQLVTVPLLKEMPQRFIDEVEYTGDNEARITFPANVTVTGVQYSNRASATASGKVVTVTGLADGYTDVYATVGGVNYDFGVESALSDGVRYLSVVRGYKSDPGHGNFYPQGAEINTAGGELTLIDKGNDGVYNQTAGAVKTNVYGFTPGVNSLFLEKSGNTTINVGMLVPSGRLRVIYPLPSSSAEGIRNVRDIGGWTCDGGTVKYNKIFRGYTLYGATASTLAYFHDYLKIRQDVSLQLSSESNYYEPSVLGADVDFIHPSGTWWYDGILSETHAGTLFNAILQAAADGKAQYIHCAAGMDRTGTVMYILETLLGLSESDKDKDYEFSSFTATRVRSDSSKWVALKKAVKSLPGSTVQSKVVKWLVGKGVSIELINAFRHAVINGSPVDLTVEGDVVTNLFDPETAIYNSRTGSDGSPKAAGERPGVLLTNLIPVDSSMETLTISGVTGIYRSDLQYCMKIVWYNSGGSMISQVGFESPIYSYDLAAAMATYPEISAFRINFCLKESGVSISTADTANLVISAE